MPEFYSGKFYEESIIPYLEHGYLWPTKIPSTAFDGFTYNMLSPIGAGLPPQYRITKEEAFAWYLNPNINPKTGREIKTYGGIYNDYRKVYEYYVRIDMINLI